MICALFDVAAILSNENFLHFDFTLVLEISLKDLVPGIDVRQGSVYAPAPYRVYVDNGAASNLCLGYVICPVAGEGQKETLVGGQTVDDGQRLLFGSVLVGSPCHLYATMVGQVLAQGHASVGMQTRQHLCKVDIDSNN